MVICELVVILILHVISFQEMDNNSCYDSAAAPVEYCERVRLLLYSQPPDEIICMYELGEITYDRLKVLQLLEETTYEHKQQSTEWKNAFFHKLSSNRLQKYVDLIKNRSDIVNGRNFSMRKEDHISHFMLRLCHCTSDREGSWFQEQEVELLTLRCSYLSADDFEECLRVHRLPYAKVSVEEKERHEECLRSSTFGCTDEQFENMQFYRVLFSRCNGLVAERKVYLQKGYAYVPRELLPYCFKVHLRRTLQAALPVLRLTAMRARDERVDDIVIEARRLQAAARRRKLRCRGRVDIEDLDRLAGESFPPCARHIYDELKRKHHTKHFGRVQLGVFLKGIGVAQDDAVAFWQGEFTKIMDEESFRKKRYAYYINYLYRSEQRHDFGMHSCQHIMSMSPKSEDCHGCPFSEWPSEFLAQKMVEYGVTPQGIAEVTDRARTGRYHAACAAYFTHTHGGADSAVRVDNPVTYYAASRDIKNPRVL